MPSTGARSLSVLSNCALYVFEDGSGKYYLSTICSGFWQHHRKFWLHAPNTDLSEPNLLERCQEEQKNEGKAGGLSSANAKPAQRGQLEKDFYSQPGCRHCGE